MEKSFLKMQQGYKAFRRKYALGEESVMQHLSSYGQKPQIMVIACCDSRVDPALILQCDPGDLFVVRNVANIVSPYEKDEMRHDTSAAIEFGVRLLKIKHLILLGHSQCGGIHSLLNNDELNKSDFIKNWVSIIRTGAYDIDNVAKLALNQSYQNCLTFPWINEKIIRKELIIHLWFFNIKTGQIFTYCDEKQEYQPFDEE